MQFLDLQPMGGSIVADVRVPGSKSITNRALVLAALAFEPVELRGVLFADDTEMMLQALQVLGYGLEIDKDQRRVRVSKIARSAEGPPAGPLHIFCGNSGTTIRFLAAMLTLGEGRFELDGVARMRQRPIGELVEQLRTLGADIAYAGAEGYPPIRIEARGLGGGACEFSHAQSSQYISAILLAAPQARQQVSVRLTGAITSEPYVHMTVRMMEQFGVGVAAQEEADARILGVAQGRYAAPGGVYAIEPDASNASYFWALAAVAPGSRITVKDLGKGSLQGDLGVVEVLAEMGAAVAYGREGVTVAAPAGEGRLRGVERDMNAIPDMVQTIAVAALFAQGRTVLKNVWNLRVKETDRLAALEKELAKFGAVVETGRDWIAITPPAPGRMEAADGPRIDVETYDDHRMAMAFAVAGLRRGNVRILNPGCTAKTYPGFFDDLLALVA